jgi:hypothetical protein
VDLMVVIVIKLIAMAVRLTGIGGFVLPYSTRPRSLSPDPQQITVLLQVISSACGNMTSSSATSHAIPPASRARKIITPIAVFMTNYVEPSSDLRYFTGSRWHRLSATRTEPQKSVWSSFS